MGAEKVPKRLRWPLACTRRSGLRSLAVTTATTDAQLVERERELDTLRALLADARVGRGALALLEAPAGHGKTALLRALRAQGAASGSTVLHAVGAELERDFAFGIVRQLFEPEVHRADEPRRKWLFRDAAALARPLLLGADAAEDPRSDVSHARLHGLFWLTANLAEEQPLLIVVDDVQWADAPSLRFLDMLARRIEGLAVLAAGAVRPGEPGAPQDTLDALALLPTAHVLRPATLSPAAVARLVQAHLGEHADERFAAACHESTGGNPLLLVELLRSLEQEGRTGSAAEARYARDAVPETVARAVVSRLRRLSPTALAVARSVAILGDRSDIARVAALSEIPREAAVAQHAVLARAGLLEAARPRFVHPLMLSAVLAELVEGERSGWHDRAARLLAQDGAPAQAVAVHLLRTAPAADGWVARTLVDAGRQALAQGAADVAVRLLRRALDEPPPVEDRADALLALGTAEAAAGDESGLEHLEQAAASGSRLVAAQAERARSIVLFFSARASEGLQALERAVQLLREPDGTIDPDLEDDLLLARHYGGQALNEQIAPLEAAATTGRRAALAHLAILQALAGAPAEVVVGLVRRALADGELLRNRVDHPAVHHALQALMMADAAGECLRAIELAAESVRRTGSRFAAALVAGTRTHWEHEFGDLRRAEDEARTALEGFRATAGPGGAEYGGAVALGTALLDQGRLAEVEALVAALPADWGPSSQLHLRSSSLRARLRLAQGRPEEALPELERQIADERDSGWIIAPRDPTRAAVVEALAALGRRDEALAFAEEQIALDHERGVVSSEARLRLAHARVLEGAERIEAAQAAADAAGRSPSPLVQAQALAELGASLRRAGQRAAAREPLREARELAHRCGASGLEALVHEELIVAGARPQRLALSGVDALTAAERRVAQLAAGGMRNREIAETLFVTVKTVEVHLGRTYSKLDIRSRSQLAGALASAAPAPAASFACRRRPCGRAITGSAARPCARSTSRRRS